MINEHDKQIFYKAHLTRDKRFDGRFFVAVKTTQIYCRPICPARKAKLENLTFYRLAAEAEQSVFRPCKRCRPETAPGSTAWLGTNASVQRALRLMDTITDNNVSVHSIATALGVSDRWLRELFQQQLGSNPQAILLHKKLDIARNLLDHSSLSITDIAYSSGFQSLRRFNDAFKKRFDKTPSEIRQRTHQQPGLQLILNYRPPFDHVRLLNFLRMRALPGIESVTENSYQKNFLCNNAVASFTATFNDNDQCIVDLKLSHATNIIGIVSKIKHLFDLDSDPLSIANDLTQSDPKLSPLIQQQPGIRIPGCFDGFEMAVRAIIGQKISVKAAQTILSRLIELFGKPYFPTAQDLLDLDINAIGLTTNKQHSLKSLATVVACGDIKLDGSADDAETRKQLLAIKGIGPWTVELIAMRALKDPDAFPVTDLEIQKKLKQYQLDASSWSPWRAYAAMLLLNDTSKAS